MSPSAAVLAGRTLLDGSTGSATAPDRPTRQAIAHATTTPPITGKEILGLRGTFSLLFPVKGNPRHRSPKHTLPSSYPHPLYRLRPFVDLIENPMAPFSKARLFLSRN